MHMEFLKVLTHDQKLKAVYKKLPNLGLLLVESRQQNVASIFWKWMLSVWFKPSSPNPTVWNVTTEHSGNNLSLIGLRYLQLATL